MEYNRVIWGSRRGMLELDLLLLPFVETRYRQLTPPQQQIYQRLLECEDQDLFAWLVHRAEPEDPELAAMVSLIRAQGASES